MVMCKVSCPACGMVIEVPYDVLATGKNVGCRGCGIEFNVDQNGQALEKKPEAPSPEKTQKTSRARSNPAPQKIQTNKSKRKTLTNVKIGTVKTVRKRGGRKSKADQQTQYFIKLAVGGLAAILAIVVIAKLASGSSKPNQVAGKTPQSVEPGNEIAAMLQKEKRTKISGSGGKASTSAVATEAAAPTSAAAPAPAEDAVLVQNVPFARVSQTDVSADQPAGDFAVKEIQPRSNPERQQDEVKQPAARTARKSPMILIPSEENEMNELRKLDRRDMTQEEKTRVDYLMNKYNWYKSMRYKYSSREEMDRRWEQRHEAIEATNKVVASRRDSLLTRPLQILLEGITDPKQRAYLMRIYQKPVSFKEKEMVRKARAQAEWERRRSDGPMRYPEDRRKKRGRDQIYTDEYGYKYYVDERGNRVYVDENEK